MQNASNLIDFVEKLDQRWVQLSLELTMIETNYIFLQKV